MPLSSKLLEILACPACKGDIKYVPEKEVLICEKCRLAYRIKQDIPIMLMDEAVKLEELEK